MVRDIVNLRGPLRRSRLFFGAGVCHICKIMENLLSNLFNKSGINFVELETGLTQRQKRLVIEVWSLARKNSVQIAVAVMMCYFKTYPKYQEAFPSFKNIPLDALPELKTFQAHCLAIFTTLGNALDALTSNDVDLMDATLITTGIRHGRRGQGRQEFIDLKPVILNTFKEELGNKFTAEGQEAFSQVLDVAVLKICEGLSREESTP